MPPIDPLRLAALRLACQLLADAAEVMPVGTVTARLTDGFHEVTVTVEPVRYGLAGFTLPGGPPPDRADLAGTGQAGAAQPGSQGRADLAVAGEIAADVRAVLAHADRPLKMTTIARRCDRFPPSSHFRRVVQQLVECGEVRHFRAGHRYWLAGRPLPGEQGGAAGAG